MLWYKEGGQMYYVTFIEIEEEVLATKFLKLCDRQIVAYRNRRSIRLDRIAAITRRGS